MNLRTWTLQDEDFTSYLNKGKEILLYGLFTEGKITEEQFNEISRSYTLVISKPSTLGAFVSKWLGLQNDDVIIHLVRVIK